MIVSRRFAKELNKDRLAELAIKYANEFAEKLESDKKIKISPQELIYNQKEAEAFFLPREFRLNSYPKEMRVLVELKYGWIRRNIKEKSAFIFNDVAYIPLSKVSEDKRILISKIIGKKYKLKNLIYSLLYNFEMTSPYLSLNGFGAEIGHLVGSKLYGQKAEGGIGEALDLLSSLYEISFDTKTLCESIDENYNNLNQFEKELINEEIAYGRRIVKIFDALLFEGETSAKQKLIEEGVEKDRIKKQIQVFKNSYVRNNHFDGYKLFFEVYESENCNLDNTYKKLGHLLSNSRINTIEDVLIEIGVHDDRLKEYKGLFKETIKERIERLSLHTNSVLTFD